MRIFDTHTVIEKLMTSGYSKQQAVGLVDLMRAYVSSDDLVRRVDLENLKLELTNKIEVLNNKVLASMGAMLGFAVIAIPFVEKLIN